MENTIEIVNLVLAKNDAYFLYFLLEANEGICFYSTLPNNSAHSGLVTIEIKFHISTRNEVQNLLKSVQHQKLFEFAIIS
jgi:hypothetical protein